ncbi:MAG: hypothetical protein WBO95_02360 [Candidatus Dechloromonas phosphoritropha]
MTEATTALTRAGIAKTTGRPIFDAEAANYWTKGEAKLVFPGSQGAHNWHPMSFNRQTGLVFIPQHTTAGNLVFQGTTHGELVAHAADSSRKLWQREVCSGVVARQMTYEVKGEHYVAFNVGWSGAFPITFGAIAQRSPAMPDSRLFVFKLRRTAAMHEVKHRVFVPPAPPPQTADVETVQAGMPPSGDRLDTDDIEKIRAFLI